MRTIVLKAVEDSVNAVKQLAQPHAVTFIEQFAEVLTRCFQSGNKVLIAGNGGSLCDAIHFAEELTGYFRKDRQALPAIALSDPGHITCTANDSSYDLIFSRAVEAYGKPGDVFVGLTTSGNSPNIIKAIETSQERGLTTVAFLGKGGGKLKGVADLELLITGFQTSDRIQEAHMAAIHIVLEVLESLLFATATAR